MQQINLFKIKIHLIDSKSILLRIKCTDGWLNCLQSHFWPVTKSKDPTFAVHLVHFNLPLVHSDFSISSWIQDSRASSLKYISVRPIMLVQSDCIWAACCEYFPECASSKLSPDTFIITVRHFRHLICKFDSISVCFHQFVSIRFCVNFQKYRH